MRHCLKTVFALSCLVFTMQFASSNANAAASCGSFSAGTKTLTAAQCVTVRKALADYTALVNKLLGANSPFAKALITLANNDTNKVCPLPPPPGNGFTVDTEFECAVPSADNSTVVSLGLNVSGGISNAPAPSKILCMSENACDTIVSTKFFVYGGSQTSRCSDPNDNTVQHLSDADMTTKINALP